MATKVHSIFLHPTKGFRSAPVGWRSRPHKIWSSGWSQSAAIEREFKQAQIIEQNAIIAQDGLPEKYLNSHAKSMRALKRALSAA